MIISMYSQRTAVIGEDGTSLSYADFYHFADEIKEKISARSLIFSFCRNIPGALAGYVAFLTNRIVPVLLDMHMEKSLAQNLMEIYKPSYLYIPVEMKEKYEVNECIMERYGYCLVKTKYHLKHDLYPELGLLLTTSGSTGSPKLVRQSYSNIQSNAKSIADYLELDESERPITTLPMSYTYGLSIINSHLLVGATILMTEKKLMQKDFWAFFRKEQVTSFGGVPYTYEMLKKLRFFQMDLPSLRTMTQAGGKLSQELHREFAKYARESNRRFIVMYGQTEATARMSYLPYQKSLEKQGSVGIAIPDGKFTLVGADGEVITEPEIAGELVYHGPNVTLGYAEKIEDLAQGDERKGRLITGDMAKMDEEGYIYIVGRKKRFLKIFGNRVNLDEIERMLKSRFEGFDFACTGVDDLLSVFVTTEEEDLQSDIRKFLSEKTGLHYRAFIVKYLEQIPKNEAGKTLYTNLERNL